MLVFRTLVLRAVTAGMLIAVAGVVTAQQRYPSKPIRFIVANPPGGSGDILARLVAEKLMESLGQQVVVDNRPGATGMIGTTLAARALPDGYTLLIISSTHVINAILVAKLPYDGAKDFDPVATLTISQFILTINPSLPAHNLKEFIALAKAKPGQLNYASSGYGAVSELAAETFNMMAGVKMQHIPYKGAGPALTELIGGQVQVYFATSISTMPHIRNGKIRAIAVSGKTRLSVLPDLPTFDEAGLPGCCAENWFGIVVPAGTPQAIIDKLSTEIAKIMRLPATATTLAGQGVEAFISTPEQFRALMTNDRDRITKVVRAANIKPR
jgi:tripartite-type tricarboxylate transporter receptor subunit TctC